jgi:hypothetical protein
MLRCFNGRHCQALDKVQLSCAPGPERLYLLTKPDIQLPLHTHLTRCLKSHWRQIYMPYQPQEQRCNARHCANTLFT